MNIKRFIDRFASRSSLSKPSEHDDAMARVLSRLDRTEHGAGGPLARALRDLQSDRSEPEREWASRIEKQRAWLRRQKTPLVDGSFVEAGLYDKDLTVAEACRASKPPVASLFLLLLARAAAPSRVIELGTNLGVSSAYIAAGAMLGGNQSRLLTLDASPYRQRWAREVHNNLGLTNIAYAEGLFTDTLQPALAALGSVDLAFIDGHHQFKPTLDYLEEIFPYSSSATIFVFDDIRWSEGMERAWEKIKSDERFGVVLDLSTVGICARRVSDADERCDLGPIEPF